MGFLLRSRRVALCLLAGLLVLVIAGCTPDASAEIISPELGAQLAAKEQGSVVVVAPAPEQVALTDLTQEEIFAGLPQEVADAIPNADPAQGQQLSVVNGCIGCHALDPGQQLTGPTWVNVGDAAANRIEGMGPALYLYQSITNPNEYVVPDFLSGIMPQTYDEQLSTEELAALVAYLLEQHE